MFENNYIPDKRLKQLKRYYRPHFSPKFNSWMIDLVYYKQNQKPIYLFILNINTRYLIVYEAKDKSADEIYRYDGLMSIIADMSFVRRLRI